MNILSRLFTGVLPKLAALGLAQLACLSSLSAADGDDLFRTTFSSASDAARLEIYNSPDHATVGTYTLGGRTSSMLQMLHTRTGTWESILGRPNLSRTVRAATIRYRLFFPASWQFRMGGKLPGLIPDTPVFGGSADDPVEFDRWSVRVMWIAQSTAAVDGGDDTHARPSIYVYDQNRDVHFGEQFPVEGFFLREETWYDIALYVKVNSHSGSQANSDGQIKLYINGVLERTLNNVKVAGNLPSGKTASDTWISQIAFHNYYGGSKTDSTWVPTVASTKCYLDDLSVVEGDYPGSTPTPTTPTLVLNRTSVPVNEGATATYTVALSSAPSANVTVSSARASGDADLTVGSGASLTFTPANWATPQTVTLAAAQDADTTNSTATFAVSASGLATVNVSASEVDNDTATTVSLVLNKTSVPVSEGATATYTVALSSAPSANVTVSSTRASGDADLTVSSGASLTFTPANWNTPQTVTLAAAQDADTTNSTATFAVSASGLATVNVSASEVDNDAPASPSTLTFSVSSTWATGYSGDVTITNNGTTTITNWTAVVVLSGTFTLDGNWKCTISKSGNTLTALPLSYNATIAPGASVTFGFKVGHTGTAPTISSMTLQ